MEVLNDDDWIRKKIILVYWNNKHISKIWENWAFYKDNYICTRFESFIHLHMRRFILKNIKQPYQKKNKKKHRQVCRY